MEKTPEEILSEIRKLAKEMRQKADTIEKKCLELEQIFENEEVEAEGLFAHHVEEDIPIDLDLPDTFEPVPACDEAAAAAVSETPASTDIQEEYAVSDENPSSSVMIDVMTDRQPWRKDIPGTEVKDIRSAISLNDRILFIKSLFAGNAESFQSSLDRLNGMETFDEAADYLMTDFPKWNFESDTVYRFMMAVRRKLR